MAEHHARLAPSSAARTIQCPASVVMQEQCPEPESEAAMEGTAAHEVALRMHYGVDVAVGDQCSHGIVVIEEMIDGAKLYCSVLSECVPQGHTAKLEQYLDCSSLHPDNGGTPDAWFWYVSKNIIYLVDYKFGYGYVEVFENWQLINYAAGVIKQISPQIGWDKVVFEFIIVQPRSYHTRDGSVRRWKVGYKDLIPYWERLRDVYVEALSHNPRTMTGVECDNCTARHSCTALRTATYQIGDWVTNYNRPDVSIADAALELTLVRKFQKLLGAIETGLAALIESEIRAGKRVPGWYLEPTNGRERWVDPDAAKTIADAMGISISKNQLITPKQAIAAGLPDSIVRMYSETPTGAGKLINDNTQLRKIFGEKQW